MVRTPKLARLAVAVDQLTTIVDGAGLSRRDRQAAHAEVSALLALLAARPADEVQVLARALTRLGEALERPSRRSEPTTVAPRARSRLLRTLRRIAAILAVAGAAPLPAAAYALEAGAPPPIVAAALPVVSVGDPVFNPLTGADEEIVEILGDGTVLTDQGNAIILATTIGDVFSVEDEHANFETYTVTGVITDLDGHVVGIDVIDGAATASTLTVVTDVNAYLDGVPDFPDGDDGSGAGDIHFPSAAGDVNNYVQSRRGSNGSNGRGGAGVKVCIPVVGCARVGKSPTSGGNGANGPTVIADVGPGVITTVSDGLPGVVASSVGGNGGDGGDAYGNFDGARGGRAGHGGNVSLDMAATVSTSGSRAHGVFAQSRSGRGGQGGTGYIAGSGGGGGNPGQGGSVTVNVTGAVATTGDDSMGVLAQSLGGAAGAGGDSYGIIGDGGGGSSGGNGGAVTVNQSGVVQTSGARSHGVLAQSIGGSGGRAGDSGGLATFGDDGGAGGDGGAVRITAQSGSQTRTTGEGAFALFGQSVGGGGGDGGSATGGWVMGSGGAAGGAGGQVEIVLESGAIASTGGADAYGVFAQSIGGGGGSGGSTSGAVSLGASGDAGGGADDVTITSAGQVSTQGENARGLFAQSVGGGGGASRRSSGAVSIGGSGGAGGAGGEVHIDVLAGGSVSTQGDNADAVFAQSVGGGGGSAQGAAGAVSIGGAGGAGGDGGTVGASNAGFIQTTGDHARGVFAQSVGGGGGSGGSTGGLVSLGGAGGGASDGGQVTVANTGVISTSGALSSAIHAQSVGGGGGDGGAALGIGAGLGGSGGGGGDGGIVTVEHGGQLFTSGDDSHGLFAQSVGGGGGSGGAVRGYGVFGGLALGGSGGDGGDGGQVDLAFSSRTVTLPGGTVEAPARIVTSGDRSRGVFAQSVGGGGGSGGWAAQVSAGYGVGAAVAIGGAGGDGGQGGQVSLTGDVDITTTGDNAEGIYAQSVGGGGGAGGFAVSFAIAAGDTVSGAFGTSVGGSGGDGGHGGLVSIESGGSIHTEGQFSTALFAQSVGGGGGAGGFAVALTGSGAGGAAGAVSVGVGGSGGGGGDGGTVDTRFDGTITTLGDDAAGAVIQSVGGGGGRGGFAVAGAIAGGGSAGAGVSVGVGGSGGGGGSGGAVWGHVGGAVRTEGDRSAGVVVQSGGGGGGVGGFAVAGSLGAGGSGSGAVSVGVGAAGGDGGDGGDVDASSGSITTLGDQSGGFLAQSTGGGGGLGGFAVASGLSLSGGVSGAAGVGVGGVGGGGGHGGDVAAAVTGDVTTLGDQSNAVTAQSTGGGGGTGGFAVAGNLAASKATAGAVSVGVGGAGGDGGDGGHVTLDVTGLTQTAGADSVAVLAQSSGGGGGSGAFAVAGEMSISAGAGGTAGAGVGGLGGGGGHGGDVTLRVNDGIDDADDTLIAAATAGDGARAIVVQSEGGGGGHGGFSVAAGLTAAKAAAGNAGVGIGGGGGEGGDGGAASAHVTGDVMTSGAGASAVLVQSGGGGGGAGGFNVTGGVSLSTVGAGNLLAGVGGYGGAGGAGGAVTGVVDGDILTLGDDAFGVTYQSTGGGGGAGAFNVTGGLSLVLNGTGGAGVLAVGVGGMGGGGGDGGTVNAEVIGDIRTEGDHAHAALFQSEGGGGGFGGFNVSGGISIASGAAGVLGVGVGGFGGEGGDGDRVTGRLTGDIVTLGHDSFGALFQSVGGGGGAGAFNITGGISLSRSTGGAGAVGVGVGGFGGAGGDGDDVDGAVIGDITTLGDEAYGLIIESVGGGGGRGGFNVTGDIGVSLGEGPSGTAGFGIGGFGGEGGDGGDVTGAASGDIMTAGQGAHGVLIQSGGGGGGSGGLNVTGSLNVSTGAGGAIGMGVGGFGGAGGDGGDVEGHLTGNVGTLGDDAFGALLQSTGAGGGSGALNVAGGVSITTRNHPTVAAGLGVGGFGGDGGSAGDVAGVVVGDYVTHGARADGVVGQSTGGGGGRGGVNVAGSIDLGMGAGGSASVGLGGFGGGGGDAGDVDLTRVGDTITRGADSDGVVVQSTGAGGGRGRVNVAGSIVASMGASRGLTLGVGGFGGDGGNAGSVSAHVAGNVLALGIGSDETDGNRHQRLNGSNGVMVQSVGGGGGGGGINVSGSLAVDGALAMGLGGFGGLGGDAGRVDLTIAAPGADRVQVAATGDERAAVIAQSIGGGGGQGGINVSGSLALDGTATLGVGGFGGDGGSASDVVAVVDADLFAAGAHARGLVAQSVGGGGGDGGVNISGGVSARSGASAPTLVFGVGGFGGGGGRAGDVDVRQVGDIQVEGAQSIGALVQSVAGGGGAGGLNVSGLVSGAGATGFSLGIGVGGAGGDGDDGGAVSLDSVGHVIVQGDPEAPRADPDHEDFAPAAYEGRGAGVIVQSIGGGGGVGGVSVTGVVTPSGSPLTVGVGGSGGAGGHGGEVSVRRGYVDVGGVETEAAGLIHTNEHRSAGLYVQSVGGGGGLAGVNVAAGFTKAGVAAEPVSLLLAVGGSGGGAGLGGAVDVRHRGDIVTEGNRSTGLFAQSVGGGGGDANVNLGLGWLGGASGLNMSIGGRLDAGGDGGAVTVDHDGIVSTAGHHSAAVTAQSIGGGGGNAGFDLALGMGTENNVRIGMGQIGGSGGIGGDVSVNARGFLDTTGDDSDGVFAQSVGGGGGRSGSLSAGGQVTEGAVEYDYSMALGLEGGDGAVGGRVAVSAAGDIVTRGERSRGVFAQSLGGGGGVGGGAFAGFLAFSGTANWGGLAVGGTGGSGSSGGETTVLNHARIATLGRQSDGVLAQSIGGGGGLGGQSIAASLELGAATPGSPSSSGVIAVGGLGGTGASGGDVTVANTGVIATAGDQSFGVRAQSIGGGGGIGGAVMNFQIQGARVSQDLSINVGGSGGSGGVGGDVSVTNQGLVLTEGAEASAIAAHSIGGGGGDAGIVLHVDLSGGAAESPGLDQVNINVGGLGGVGGAGGDVTVVNDAGAGADPAALVTLGDRAHGVLAQSIGGGGGNGSSILSFTASAGGRMSTAAGLNVGGSGGSGEQGGQVTVRNTGLIDTSGEGAHGILAQSIGGGGGNAGLVLSGRAALTSSAASPLINLGGFGGDGGDGGAVRVDNSGQVITRGARSHGVVAQSIGGGGGDGQIALGLSGGLSSLVMSETLNAVIGGAFGFGGAGGAGGAVTVNHSGDITVLGEGSTAIRAESINGGGGSLTMDLAGVVGMPGVPVIGASGEPERPDPLVSARLGGERQSDMNGGRVTVNTTGTFGAAGDHGAGDFVQSVGGGGGSLFLRTRLAVDAGESEADEPAPLHVRAALGGLEGADNAGGELHGVHSGDITTLGMNAPGVLVQSVGGGGGRAVVHLASDEAGLLGDVDLTLGGVAGTDEAGGSVTREHAGTIVSTGARSPGMILQSIGGGGGSASVTLDGDGASGAGVSAALGAFGGAGLDGGDVRGDVSGGVLTFGDHAPAIMLQSVGAGGGETRIGGGAQADIRLGASDGAEGDGGDVTLVNDGVIVTGGTQAHGLFLQSVGGGGGAVFGGARTVDLASENSGDGGDIILRQAGDIIVTGAGAHGVIAQSVGGGGGWVDGLFAGAAGGAGSGGAIDLALSGDVLATGAGGVAVFAQSVGAGSGGDIVITTDGRVRGDAAGVRIDGGADNNLLITGSVSAISGTAIEGTYGNDHVLNQGLVVGDVGLGGGDNAFVNDQGAVFVTHGFVDLGGGTFTNSGDLLMGLSAPRLPLDLAAGETFGDLDGRGDPAFNLLYGTRVISTVALNGDFVQTADGRMAFDVAFGPYGSDRVDVTGDAVVDGAGDITLTWLENAEPVTLFATGGAGVDHGLEITDTLAIDYRVLADGNGVHLAFTSDFGQPFLNADGRALGGHMDSALMAGSSGGIGRLAAMLGNLQAGEEALYAAVFEQLNPEAHTAPLIEQFASSQAFAGRLFGCDRPGSRRADACTWAVAQGGVSESAGDADTYEARSRFSDITTGFHRPLDDRWSVAGALGYGRLNALDVDGARAHMSGQGVNLGLGVRYDAPDSGLQLSASASGGWTWLESIRRMDVFAAGIGEAKPEVGHAMLGAQAAWLARKDRLFIRPALNVSATVLRHDGFVETGLEGLGARAEADSQWFGTLNPELTVGLVVQESPASRTTFSVNLGAVHHTTDHIDLPVRFVGASDTSDTAVMRTAMDRSHYRVGADLTVVGDERLSVRVSYDGRFGDRTERHSAGIAVRLRF